MIRRQHAAVSLPTRDGVGPSCVALPMGAWQTMLQFLAQRFPAISMQEWSARMARGDVFDVDGVPLPPEAPFRPNARIFYYRSLPPEPPIPFRETVLYLDELIVAVDKPHFLPVTPGGSYLQETLLVRLKRGLGIDTLTPMHRLDRDTAGLVLFTIAPATRDRYQALFRERAVHKTYQAIAAWRPELSTPLVYRSRLVESASFMQMQPADGAPNAETRISVMAVHGAMARYRLEPSTGQKHQLRAHMAALGMPILNDRIYPHLQPAASATAPPDFSRPLQLLASELRFIDPLTGLERHFESRQHLTL